MEFPDEMYVKYEQVGDEEGFYLADTNAGDLLSREEPTKVATYRLVRVSEGKLEPSFTETTNEL